MPTSLLFLINGISSLLAWNAVLSSLDYFAYVYADYSVYTLFTPPLFVGYFIICLLYQKLSLKFSYRVLIIFGITVANVALVLLLLLALTCKESQAFGFYMSLICNFTLGVGANCSQLSFFSMINYLSQSVVSRFTIGTALSGLSLNILRLIIVAIAGTDN
jgi:equilibrative nucleoside transporter 1/2/3